MVLGGQVGRDGRMCSLFANEVCIPKLYVAGSNPVSRSTILFIRLIPYHDYCDLGHSEDGSTLVAFVFKSLHRTGSDQSFSRR